MKVILRNDLDGLGKRGDIVDVADGYGRKLRIVNVNGTSVGATLVSEGLARWYAGGRKGWC